MYAKTFDGDDLNSETVDISCNIKNSAENLWQVEEYLRSRGISLRTATELNCGFIAELYHSKVLEKFKGKPAFERSPRLIIPSSKESYLARNTRALEEISQEERGYIKQKAGNAESNVGKLEKELRSEKLRLCNR